MLDVAARIMRVKPPTRQRQQASKRSIGAEHDTSVQQRTLRTPTQDVDASPLCQVQSSQDCNVLADASLEPSAAELQSRTDLAHALYAQTQEPAQWLAPVLGAIVTASSQRQALAGLVATGPLRSVWYVGLKLQKRLRSMTQKT